MTRCPEECGKQYRPNQGGKKRKKRRRRKRVGSERRR